MFSVMTCLHLLWQRELLGQVKTMEDRLVSTSKEKASIIVSLKRDLAEANREAAAKEEALIQIQHEHHTLLKNMRVSAAQHNGTSIQLC